MSEKSSDKPKFNKKTYVNLTPNSSKENYPVMGKYLIKERELLTIDSFNQYLIRNAMKWDSNDRREFEFLNSHTEIIKNDTLQFISYKDLDGDARGIDGCYNHLLIYNFHTKYLFIYGNYTFNVESDRLYIKCDVRGRAFIDTFIYNSELKEYRVVR